MNLDLAGAAFLKKEEGCRLKAYKDSAGKWTIGFGCRDGVVPGLVISPAQAELLFEEAVEPVEEAVNEAVDANVPLSQGEFNALVSLVYNIGEEDFQTSTLLQRLNQGDKRGAAKQFRRWVWIHTEDGEKEVCDDLAKRRAREAAMFLQGAGIEWQDVFPGEAPPT